MKFLSEQGDIITIKVEPKTVQECYVQSLRVNLYTVRGTNLSAATPPKVEIPETWIKEECNNVETTCPRPEVFQCFNIETKQKEKQEDKIEVDLDPRAEFEEGRPIFDEPVTSVQLRQQPNQCTKVGRIMNRLLKNEIYRVIVGNAGLFG